MEYKWEICSVVTVEDLGRHDWMTFFKIPIVTRTIGCAATDDMSPIRTRAMLGICALNEAFGRSLRYLRYAGQLRSLKFYIFV